MAANSLNFYNNYFITGDYAVSGVGLRATGAGGVATANITISGIPANADIVAAFLYWQTLDNTQLVNSQTVCGNPNPTATFNSFAITPVQLSYAASPRQSQNCVATYRADVFGLLNVVNAKQIPNGTYQITVPDSGNAATAPSTEGASLIVIYRVNGAPFKSIVIYDGTSTIASPRDMFNVNIQGFYQASTTVQPQAKVTYLVGDGQAPASSNQMSFNGTTIFTNAATGSAGPFWDNLTANVSSYVPQGASQVTASSTFGTDAITFSAVVFCTTVQDTDGDGLLDTWETNGYTDMTDGTFINLPAMGANPNVKDIFVEIDWMVAAGHSHLPKAAALAKVVAGFQGAAGGAMNIHFDYGQGGLYTGGNAITEVLPTQWKWDTAQSPGFLTIKNANFAHNRRHIFHYQLWAHQRPPHPDPANPGQLVPNSASGIADLPGSDSMITLGLWRHPNTPDDQVGTLEEQAGTLMHELGHNLNLHHGGGDDVNCKPDYQSIMSYSYQVIGLTTLNGSIFFDYSRQILPGLNENALDESAGLGTTTYRARWFATANNLDILLNRRSVNLYCDGTPRSTPVVAIDSNAVSGPLNWDNDVNGVITQLPLTVAADVNDDGSNNTYSGYSDWQNLDLHHVSSGYAFSEGEIANIEGEIANGEIANIENGEIANIADGEIANFDTNGEIDFDLAQAIAVPPSPTSLAARINVGAVRLAWNAVRQSNVNQYRIFRFNTTTGSLATAVQIGSVTSVLPAAPLPIYTDSTTVAGTMYSYFVNAADDQNHNSQISNIISVLAK